MHFDVIIGSDRHEKTSKLSDVFRHERQVNVDFNKPSKISDIFELL